MYGKTKEEHDLAVSRTLDRLHRSGLTVNPKKCEFGKDRVTFFGYVFSAAGMSPDPLKVKSLQDTAEPQNASKVHSLMGMAEVQCKIYRQLRSYHRTSPNVDQEGHGLALG